MENNGKFKDLMGWFDYMNEQFEKLEDIRRTGKINSILIDNDIEIIKDEE